MTNRDDVTSSRLERGNSTSSRSSRADATLERLASGVLLPGFIGTSTPPWLLRALEDGLAGVVYFGSNFASVPQLTALSASLRSARDDVLIAVDEEGGDVTRLHAGVGSDLPGNAALGVLDDVSATSAVASSIGRELRQAGINLNLAPCVDVNSDPANPVIGVRSFGSSPELVGRHGAAFVGGLQSAGVAACAKHFPGHGDTKWDSHAGQTIVDVAASTVLERELPPFAACVAAGARCVLTAHVMFSSLDASQPATLSPVLLGLLRDDLGFDGVAISDALDMWAIARTIGVADGAVAALRAGVDLLCLGNPGSEWSEPDRGDGSAEVSLVRRAIVDAVRSGSLPASRLEEAAARVRSLASWTVAARSLPLPAAAPPGFGRSLARRAVSVTGSVSLAGAFSVTDLRRHVNAAAGRNSAALLDELARRALAGGSADGRLVILVDEPQRDEAVRAELRSLLAASPDAVVIATGWPDPAVDLGPNVVRTFGNARANAQAAADVLFGQVNKNGDAGAGDAGGVGSSDGR